jgi:hypothetical protein
MKKRSVLVAAVSLFAAGSLAWADDLPWEMKLPFKEAAIHYELTGSEQGKETLYVKDYGQRRAEHHKATTMVMGMSNPSETLELTDPDWITTYNLIDNTGEKTSNPRKIYQAEYNKFSAAEKKNFEKNAKELGAGMMGSFGGSVKQKAEKVLGYDCDVAAIGGGMSTVSMIHNTDVPLRSEVSVMGMKSVNVAVKVDTSAVPDSAFAPPAGITAVFNQEAETMMAGMVQQAMDTLKQPDGAKKMQQMGQPMVPGGMQQGMEAEGISKEDQQAMMQQMQEAMQQMQQVKPQQ